ncbi:Sulfoacetaldehyde dehydrogenase (acylating) [Nymphon striatum]|nr:Sulfoacetaldehyde dehydrogenase (acylating) [Nymphon striatum]
MPIAILNKPGAGGRVGWNWLAGQAEADGYTLGAYNIPHFIAQSIKGGVSYSADSFEPIANWDRLIQWPLSGHGWGPTLTLGHPRDMTAQNDQADLAQVDAIVARARAAQIRFEAQGSQERYDRAAQAAAWAIMEPARNKHLAELAVNTTGLGNVPDKIIKNHRKTLGLMRDIATAKTYGVIRDDPDTGITEIARPMGVIGAVVPSTNPAATPANNIINALKCGNAIVLSPSPKGVPACEVLLGYIHAEFDKIGEDHDLVQMVPGQGSKAKTQRLLEVSDLIVVTGSQNNVKRAYTSGTPALAVGAGNVTVIVDETCDLDAAAEKITASKTFDNATSCSSENAIVVVDAIYDDFIAALAKAGGARIRDEAAIVAKLWPDGHLNRSVIAQDADKMLAALGMAGDVPADTKFLAVETSGIGADHPLSGEKLSRIAALYQGHGF